MQLLPRFAATIRKFDFSRGEIGDSAQPLRANKGGMRLNNGCARHASPGSCYMEDVEIAAVVAGIVIVAVAAVVVIGRHRRSADSVMGYRQTLSTLQHLQDRSPVRGGEADRGPVPGGAPRRTQRSLHVMNRAPRRIGGVVAVAALVLAAVGALVYVGVRSDHRKPGTSVTTTTGGNHHATTTTTTSTTLPARYTPVSSTTGSATYAPVTASYTLLVGATTGDCWVSVTEANGTTVLSQTLTPGTSRTFSMSGKTTIVIGAPSVVKVTIDDVPAVLPPGAQAPYTMVLAPAS
jgi:hypothetical protein